MQHLNHFQDRSGRYDVLFFDGCVDNLINRGVFISLIHYHSYSCTVTSWFDCPQTEVKTVVRRRTHNARETNAECQQGSAACVAPDTDIG
jgi:hypothetical protein